MTLRIVFLGLIFLASWLMTGMVRRYAQRAALLDIPNHRSSHSVPTPRGGGLAIVVVLLAAEVVALALGWIPTNVAVGLVVGGIIMAGMGWLDDHHSLPARVRIAAQLVAAVWVIAWVGVPTELVVGAREVPIGYLGYPLTLLTIIWFTNLYNFMDGIDGLAAAEAIAMGGFGAILLAISEVGGLPMIGLAIASASAGFLVWNWAPARIFMGDVGSCFLGFSLAVLAIAADRAGAVPALAWVILGCVFLFDATVTLVRRVRRGEKWYTAHNSHAYQRAVQSGLSHATVTLLVMALNVCLFGLAWIGTQERSTLPLALAGAFALVGFCYVAVGRRRPM